jgi:hypothetical protein
MSTKQKENNQSRFNIDFFEFSFLVEACIPPRPIARAMFWNDVISKYYYVLTPDEREHLFEWINKNSFFVQSLKGGNEECALFNARFDSNNQYKINILFEGREEVKDCFKWNNHYHTSKSTSIIEDYITSIEKQISHMKT